MGEIHIILYSQENTNTLVDQCSSLSYVITNAVKERLHHDFCAIATMLVFLFPGPRITAALNLVIIWSMSGALFQYKQKVHD